MAKSKLNLKALAASFGNHNLSAHAAAAKVIQYFMHVRITMAVDLLGTKALNPETFQAWILSKAPIEAHAQEMRLAEKTLTIIARELFGDAAKFDELSEEDQIKAVDAALKELSGTSIFHKDEKGTPVIWDYQVRGHLKAMADSFRRAQNDIKKQAQEERDAADKAAAKAAGKEWKQRKVTGKEELYGMAWPASGKKHVDLSVFVFPRLIPLSVNETGICERPLRAEVFDSEAKRTVERITLARSETVPAGTTMEFIIGITEASPFGLEHVAKMLDYGYCHGYGQWRNSGKGAFTWNCLGIYEDLSEEDMKDLIKR